MGWPLAIPWQEDERTLFQWYRAEKRPDLKPRLHALWLLRKGHGLGETAAMVGVHYVTLQQWVAWYRKGGIGEVRAHRKAGPGQPAWLTPEQQEQFRYQVAQGRFRTARGAVQWVAEHFGVQYKLKGMYSLLQRVQGRKKGPRPLATTTSMEAQEAWKKGD
jgi:transposase